MREALQNLLYSYLRLANSGDCGNWDPEEEKEVIAARAALKDKDPELTGKIQAAQEVVNIIRGSLREIQLEIDRARIK